MSRRGWCYSAVCGRERQRGERLFIVRRFGEDVGMSFGADLIRVLPLDVQREGISFQFEIAFKLWGIELGISVTEPQDAPRPANHFKVVPFTANEEVRRGLRIRLVRRRQHISAPVSGHPDRLLHPRAMCLNFRTECFPSLDPPSDLRIGVYGEQEKDCHSDRDEQNDFFGLISFILSHGGSPFCF